MSHSPKVSNDLAHQNPYKALFVGSAALSAIVALAIGGVVLSNLHSLDWHFCADTSNVLLGAAEAGLLLLTAFAGYKCWLAHQAEKQRKQETKDEKPNQKHVEIEIGTPPAPGPAPASVPAQQPLEHPVLRRASEPLPPPPAQPPAMAPLLPAPPPEVVAAHLGVPLGGRAEAVLPPEPVPLPTPAPAPVAALVQPVVVVNVPAPAQPVAAPAALKKEDIGPMAKNLLLSMKTMFASLIDSQGRVDSIGASTIGERQAALTRAFGHLDKITQELLDNPAYLLGAALIPSYQEPKDVRLDTSSSKKFVDSIRKFYQNSADAQEICDLLGTLTDQEIAAFVRDSTIQSYLQGIRDGKTYCWDKTEGGTQWFIKQSGKIPHPNAGFEGEMLKQRVRQQNFERLMVALLKKIPKERSEKVANGLVDKVLPEYVQMVFDPICVLPNTMIEYLGIVKTNLADAQAKGITTIRGVIAQQLSSSVVEILDYIPASSYEAAGSYVAALYHPSLLEGHIPVLRTIAGDLAKALGLSLWNMAMEAAPAKAKFQKKFFELMASRNQLGAQLLKIQDQLKQAQTIQERIRVLHEEFCNVISKTFTDLAAK